MRLLVAHAGQRTCTQFGVTLMAILYKRCLSFVLAVFSLVSAPIKSSVSIFAKVQLHKNHFINSVFHQSGSGRLRVLALQPTHLLA